MPLKARKDHRCWAYLLHRLSRGLRIASLQHGSCGSSCSVAGRSGRGFVAHGGAACAPGPCPAVQRASAVGASNHDDDAIELTQGGTLLWLCRDQGTLIMH